jgi:hypothetical protein
MWASCSARPGGAANAASNAAVPTVKPAAPARVTSATLA